MPYFIYRIDTPHGIRQLQLLERFDSFRPASARAKDLRRQLATNNTQVKVIHAENELAAEDLLNQVREAEPLVGDDY